MTTTDIYIELCNRFIHIVPDLNPETINLTLPNCSPDSRRHVIATSSVAGQFVHQREHLNWLSHGIHGDQPELRHSKAQVFSLKHS
jgi:hypothetical protein